MVKTKTTQGYTRINLSIPNEMAETLDSLAQYLSLGTRPDAVRYLMAKGLESFRVGQTMKDQADMFAKFVNVISEEMDRATEKVPVPSSTGTTAQKCPPSKKGGTAQSPIPFTP